MTDIAKAVERLEELLAKASPLPWSTVHVTLSSLIYAGGNDRFIARVEEYNQPPAPTKLVRKANADLIVTAVNALPALLAENARLTKLVAEREGWKLVPLELSPAMSLERRLVLLLGIHDALWPHEIAQALKAPKTSVNATIHRTHRKALIEHALPQTGLRYRGPWRLKLS